MASFVVCPHEDERGKPCGERVEAPDESSLVDAVRRHARREHDLSLDREAIEGLIEAG